MEAALWVAKTGLDAQQTRMTVIASTRQASSAIAPPLKICCTRAFGRVERKRQPTLRRLRAFYWVRVRGLSPPKNCTPKEI
jgi:hypothetical protein